MGRLLLFLPQTATPVEMKEKNDFCKYISGCRNLPLRKRLTNDQVNRTWLHTLRIYISAPPPLLPLLFDMGDRARGGG